MAGSCGWRGSSSGGLRELLSLCWSVTVEQVVVPKETQANSCTAWLCDCSLCWFIWMPFSCHMIHQSQDASLCALCVSVVSLNYFNLHRVLTYCILKCWRFFFFPCSAARACTHLEHSIVPHVTCRFSLNTNFILVSWGSFVKANIPSNMFCTNVTACCKAGNGVWLLGIMEWSMVTRNNGVEYGYSILLIGALVVLYWWLRPLQSHCNKRRVIWNPLRKGSYF